MSDNVAVTLTRRKELRRVAGTRVCFSPFQCFAVLDDETAVLLRHIGDHLARQPNLHLWQGPLLRPLLEAAPTLRTVLHGVIPATSGIEEDLAGLPAVPAAAVPAGATVFLCQTRALERMDARVALGPKARVFDAEIAAELVPELAPARAWTPLARNIYPVDLPKIAIEPDLDLLLIDCPARNLALMPNGLAYVHNALKRTSVRFQTFDLDIITYHRYHIRRLFDEGGRIVLPSGREMPTDPWQAEHYDLWSDPEVIVYLSPIIDEAAAAIIAARPKVLGLSIQGCNETFSTQLVARVKAALPDVVILTGGFSCYNADIGLRAFPAADYMCIGEADLTVGPLAERLARGERPKDQPGVLSRFDTPGRMFIPAPMPHNLDQIDFPRYEWCDLSLYRNYNGYQLVPIIASRGCRWSRCTFCAERFYWRIRSAKNFVDELEWLVDQGCTLFMFNESDLNGIPEKVLEICDEIIRRDLKVKLTGQLRINKKSDRAYFDKLRQAGFVALRFGVDAFSENTLRLQKKGYTVEMVSQNLRDCWEAGIYTEVNWVIGIPGETDADCEEGIKLILANQRYIGRLANINPLIMVNGGVYWIDPEGHNIRFREPRDELYAKYPRALPADSWYSVEPYIDAQVRKERFEHIVLRLHEAGFPVGAWAARVIEDVKTARDRARTAQTKSEAVAGSVPADSPHLVRSLPTHNVVRYRDTYYAIPLALGEVDLRQPGTDALPGIISDSSETALLVEIEHAKGWADSRGHYDAREKQRAAGSLYKAGSALGEADVTQLHSKPLIVRFGGEFIALERDRLESPIEAVEDTGPLGGRRTSLHRIFDMLPRRARRELRAIWRAYRLAMPMSNERPDNLTVVATIAAGFVDRYVLRRRPARSAGQVLPGTDLRVIRVVTEGVQPELLTTIAEHNIVEFDGRFYALPFGLPVDWHETDPATLAGVIVGSTAREVIGTLRARMPAAAREPVAAVPSTRGSGPAGETSNVPILLDTIEDYNIVSYEGWIYGLPHRLGEIDLAETDVIGLDGVIRDVSRDVVENQIRERSALVAQAAE